jgi:hypothetical protein
LELERDFVRLEEHTPSLRLTFAVGKLFHLVCFNCNTNAAEIGTLQNISPEGHADKPSRLNNLGKAFQTRFERNGNLADIASAISMEQKAVELTPEGTDSLIAVQTKFGKQGLLRIHIPPQDGFRKIYDDLRANSELRRHFSSISLVDKSKDAQVEVRLNAKDEVRFTMHIEVTTPDEMSITQVVDGVEADLHHLAWIFSKIAHFYRELKYSNNNPRISHSIDVELYKLTEVYKPNEDTGFEDVVLEKFGPNQCIDGVINLVVPDADAEAEGILYGLKLVNNSTLGLHANMFYFSSHDLSISACLSHSRYS